MADQRFFQYDGPFSVAEIAGMTGARLLDGHDGSVVIKDVAPLELAGQGDIGFLENRRYLPALADSGASACLISEELVPRAPRGMILLVTDRPRRNFAKISRVFYPEMATEPGIHDQASLAPSARLGAGCRVDAGAVIGEHARLGDGVWVGANVVIEEAVTLGAATRVGSNASLSHCDIGERCVIYPGVRIGQPGFGFEADASGPIKMPQLGRVIIGNDVEVGANTTIDRGAGPDTTIGQGTMIDNLVQIGHNVEIGRGCIIVAQVGIAGSTKIGDYVVLAGQVGIAGHLRIGDRVQVAAQSGINRVIADGEVVGGSPAVPIRDFRRQVAAVKRLGRRAKSEA